MSVIWSGRDRSEKYPQAVLRGTQPKRRHGGHITRLVSGPVTPTLRRWIPENWGERADAWLWEHPAIHTVAACLLVGGLMWALIYLTLKVARMGP